MIKFTNFVMNNLLNNVMHKIVQTYKSILAVELIINKYEIMIIFANKFHFIISKKFITNHMSLHNNSSSE